MLQADGAPDLIKGVGRLLFKEVKITDNPTNEKDLEVTGQTPGISGTDTQPPNIAQRLMAQSGRSRTASTGAISDRKIKKAKRLNPRHRSYSTGNQQKIDEMFGRSHKGN